MKVIRVTIKRRHTKWIFILLFFLVSYLLYKAGNRTVKVDDASKAQIFEFDCGCRYGFPYQLQIDIEGELNGKAILDLRNNYKGRLSAKRDEYFTRRLPGAKFNRRIWTEYMGEKIIIVYEPITATDGEVTLHVDFPWFCLLGR